MLNMQLVVGCEMFHAKDVRLLFVDQKDFGTKQV